MVATDLGKSGLALAMVGSLVEPRFCEIGSGSGANVPTIGSLVAGVGSRAEFSSRSIATQKEVQFTFDFGAPIMSGVNLTEFGMGPGSAQPLNDLWNREGFSPAVTFDGTNELQIQITYQVF